MIAERMGIGRLAARGGHLGAGRQAAEFHRAAVRADGMGHAGSLRGSGWAKSGRNGPERQRAGSDFGGFICRFVKGLRGNFGPFQGRVA